MAQQRSRLLDDFDFMRPSGLSIDGPLFAVGPVPPPPGPFDRSAEKPTAEEILIGEMIYKHQGRTYAVSLGELASVTKLEARVIKATVQRLRNTHLCAIGSKHHDPPGYFWIVDDEDRNLAVGPLRSQILAMWDTLQVLGDRANNSKLLEQLRGKL